MANNTIEMNKLRQIIKLYCQGQSKLTISHLTGVSRNTIKKYVDRFIFLKTTWDEIGTLSDKDLEDLFREENEEMISGRLEALYRYFPIVEKQLKRRGMTMNAQWRNYFAKHPDGYQRTSFYDRYMRWKQSANPSMRMEHKAGEKMFVDFAGERLRVLNKTTGELEPVEVFIAILGASQYTFVMAVESQKVEDFIYCCRCALEFFQGAPQAIVTDNLKSAVIRSSRFEPIINENFEAFANYYGMAVLPTRSYKPKDKALVEGAVKITYNRIYGPLDESVYETLADLNKAIEVPLGAHNATAFQGRNYSRVEQFKEMEQPALAPLPDKPFELRKQLKLSVMKNGHICLTVDKHYYSVPYQYLKEKVKVLYSKSQVDIYHKYELIASHPRVKSPHNYTTDPQHLATHHRFISEWNADKFISEANAISEEVGHYITMVLQRKRHPEQAYKSCQGILSFARRLGKERLIIACKRAIGYGIYNYKMIEKILQKGLDKYDQETELPTMPEHDNIRGESYYN